jgi:predicted ATPase/DNA-binding CsgD family transcriptional regulator
MVTTAARAAPPGNLPADVTSFIGRRHELSEAKRLLSSARLLTLTGPGGVGKTRLALRVSGEVQRAFPDGVWLVELAALHDPALLAVTVAETLGLRDQSVRWGMSVLAEYLSHRRLLLVLDNCEHLVDACAELADTLLRACPELRILATSRQPLGIIGEATLAVPPLSVPDADRAVSAAGLVQYEAANLLIDRASAVLPGFTVDDDNCVAVAQLCRSLDGIPLAIELAAVRLRALSLDQIVSRLDDRYRLLTTGSRSAPARQQTLRALIDWSYELCSEAERTTWARLSVFSGGFELDAAEVVCSGDGIEREAVFDLVASLVDKSIIMRDEHDHLVRYRLLETIREYGEERLREAGDLQALRRRHRDWYAQLTGRADARWFGSDQAESIRRLRREHANLRSALEFCVSMESDGEAALRMAASLENYWFVHGFLGEARLWLGRALLRESTAGRARAKALRVDAWLALLHGDQQAQERLTEARELAEHLPDPLEIAYVTQIEASAAMFAGDLRRAAALFEDALVRFRTLSARSGEMWSLLSVGLAAGLGDDRDRAYEALEECITVTAASGDVWWRSHALWALGLLAWRDNDLDRAAEFEKESLRLKRSLEEQWGYALSLEAMAWIVASQRQYERSAQLLGAADGVWRRMRVSIAAVFRGMGAFHDQCVTRCTEHLGKPAYEAAFRRGAQLSSAEAVEFALEEKSAAQPSGNPATAPSPLTRREREIADLVAEGLSNREIAASLVIAQRTAEGHVEHILSKLGFTSRVQVAAWVAEQRGTAPSA